MTLCSMDGLSADSDPHDAARGPGISRTHRRNPKSLWLGAPRPQGTTSRSSSSASGRSGIRCSLTETSKNATHQPHSTPRKDSPYVISTLVKVGVSRLSLGSQKHHMAPRAATCLATSSSTSCTRLAAS
eukprot:5386084-Amphidinium_carterae.1